MKRILETLKIKWPEYLLEILVIVIGIYGAFSLDNWNDDRKQKVQELEILQSCYGELQSDLKDINLNIFLHTRSLKSIDLIIIHMESDSAYNKSLEEHFLNTVTPTRFIHSTSAFESLKAKGLDIVSNQTIRHRLVELYDGRYEFFLMNENNFIDEIFFLNRHVFPTRFKEGLGFDLDSEGFTGKMIPNDYEKLRNEREYLYHLQTQKNRLNIHVNFMYAGTKKRVEDLILLLEHEIEVLKGQ